ncbi:hypothetical protein [Moraxella lacunata]
MRLAICHAPKNPPHTERILSRLAINHQSHQARCFHLRRPSL